ncbi:TetR/AcrR family transcriptional regulator [Amycolatopsis sp. NPDC059021]|uniref:TetR/AcrR family transcriptional regulator n=1 Tax=Amycolatopsis sp. NPDC059021 TaxID=3346704 RepID=UPI00366FA8E4
MARPKQALISRDGILRAALRLVDEHGPDALSTNRIAAELGVKGPSLYNHVSGRDEIIEGLRELLTADMDLAAADLRPWTLACDRVARSYRASFAAHPHVVPLLTAQPVRSPTVLAAYDKVFAVLREAGWPEDDLVPVVRAIEYLVIGSVHDQATGLPDDAERAFDIGLSALIDGLERRLAGHGDARTS